MADIAMDYSSMAAMEALAQTKHDELESMLDELDRLVSAAEKNWRGHGHKKFMASFAKVEADLRIACEGLAQYVTAIKQAQSSMDELESALKCDIEKITIQPFPNAAQTHLGITPSESPSHNKSKNSASVVMFKSQLMHDATRAVGPSVSVYEQLKNLGNEGDGDLFGDILPAPGTNMLG